MSIAFILLNHNRYIFSVPFSILIPAGKAKKEAASLKAAS
jgi:hypothetical protein